MCWFDIIVDVCVALGGLGTVGTLVYMIYNAKTQAKQVKRVQEVQSLQLDVLYKPDARIVAWIDRLSNASLHPSIRIENNGENLIINEQTGHAIDDENLKHQRDAPNNPYDDF